MKTTIAFYLRDRYYQMDGELSEEDFEQAEEMEEKQRGYSEEDMKQFGLYLGDNLKKLKGKSIDELFTNFKQQ